MSAHRRYRKLLNYWAIFVTNLIVLTIGVALVFSTQSPLRDVGTSLVASGIVGWFSLYVVNVQDRRRENICRLMDSGLIDIYPNRSDPEIYKKRLEKCQKHLDIQAESLTRFSSDFKAM